MKTLPLAAALTLAFVSPLAAGPRASAGYTVATDTLDSAGRRATSGNYTHTGSLGGLAGVGTVASPAETNKAGYAAQLYEVASLQLSASPASLNEGATRQLAAAQVLHDQTTLAVPAVNVTWSVASGPLAGIDSAGLATAAAVYQNTSATAQGVHAGLTATLGLAVFESVPDNFGAYAADGLGDDWQVQYFGLNNPAAAPALDPDADGQNNLFEFTAGLVPTDAASVFTLQIASVPGQPAQRQLVFTPRLAGRTYVVKSTASLTPANWTTLAASTTQDAGAQRTVTDTAATEPMKFYRVEITRP